MNFRLIRNLVLRYLLVWIGDAASIGFTALVLPGIYFLRESPLWYLHPFVVALGFGLLNALVRPVLILLLLPITFATLGLATLLVNAAVFYVMHIIVDSFVIESFGAALIGILVLTLVNTLLGNLVRLGDDYSFYATMMDKFSALTRPKEVDLSNPGVVILQIDGLAYNSLRKAIRRGKLPYLSNMLKRRRFVVQKWFSGLPSQTSAVQAAMFYGSKYDVPGFRWYSKAKRKMYVSSHGPDMATVDQEFADAPNPLLRDGSCINSLLHGGASKKILTVSQMADRDLKQHRASLEDFAIFSMHPYLYTRTMFMMFWDFCVDRTENLLDIIRRKKPKLRRSIKSSFLRAVSNSFFREATTYFVMEDIIRGIRAIYTNYVGYDIVAHYGGPNSWDAFNTLTGIDRQIKKVDRIINRRASRHYNLVILSDHGQTPSIPFKRLYGRSLSEVIEDKLKRPLIEITGHTAELGYFTALLREMRLAEAALGSRPMRRRRATLERLHQRIGQDVALPDDEVAVEKGEGARIVVCANGNLAHVYFTHSSDRVTTDQVIENHPGLLEFLVAHAGIGFVATTNDDGEHLVMGKKGMRRLKAREVEGTDPLEDYVLGYDADALAEALIELCSYPNSGDLIINGSLLTGGAVVSFEDQRGTHGGLGGDQTEPFIIFPRHIRHRGSGPRNPLELHRFLTRILSEKHEALSPAHGSAADGREELSM